MKDRAERIVTPFLLKTNPRYQLLVNEITKELEQIKIECHWQQKVVQTAYHLLNEFISIEGCNLCDDCSCGSHYKYLKEEMRGLVHGRNDDNRSLSRDKASTEENRIKALDRNE